jgi:hypothetical protein
MNLTTVDIGIFSKIEDCEEVHCICNIILYLGKYCATFQYQITILHYIGDRVLSKIYVDYTKHIGGLYVFCDPQIYNLQHTT